jgi:hypothetical protein
VSYDAWLQKPYTDRDWMEIDISRIQKRLLQGSVQDFIDALGAFNADKVEEILDGLCTDMYERGER